MRKTPACLWLTTLVVTACTTWTLGPALNAVSPSTVLAAQSDPSRPEALDHLELLTRLLFRDTSEAEAQRILHIIATSGDRGFVVGLIDTLRYQPVLQDAIGQTLNQLTGQQLTADWFTWVEWAGAHPEIPSFATYTTWKAHIFGAIDANFRRFVYPGMRTAPGSRVEELVWGAGRWHSGSR